MTSYEEMVVDRSVEAAWLEFRVRVADHLAAMDEADYVRLGLTDGAGDPTDHVMIRSYGLRGFTVTWQWADGADRPGARHRRAIRVTRARIDAYVLRLSGVLLAAGAPHPSFVHVLEGDLVLVDSPVETTPTPALPTLPVSVMPTSHDELVEWVDRTLTERLGRLPRKRDDGSIGIFRSDDARLTIRISRSRPIIEVWATVAKDVDVRKARKLLPKLNASFHFFAFSLVGDRVTVATTVDAKPFCPEHLDRAIDSTFDYLEEAAGDVRAKLTRKAPRADLADNAIDPDLLLVYGVHTDAEAMIEMARALTGSSRTALEGWRQAALEAGRAARKKASKVEHGPVQHAMYEQSLAWTDVVIAINQAVQDIDDDREPSR